MTWHITNIKYKYAKAVSYTHLDVYKRQVYTPLRLYSVKVCLLLISLAVHFILFYFCHGSVELYDIFKLLFNFCLIFEFCYTIIRKYCNLVNSVFIWSLFICYLCMCACVCEMCIRDRSTAMQCCLLVRSLICDGR